MTVRRRGRGEDPVVSFLVPARQDEFHAESCRRMSDLRNTEIASTRE
jgi:hypothetical protein